MALTAILACTTKCRISSMPIQAPPHGRGASQIVLHIVREADRVRYSIGFARVPDVGEERMLEGPGHCDPVPGHELQHALDDVLGIHYRGVQWEGGAVDGGGII